MPGSEVAQSLMRTDGVVGAFPGQEFAVELGDGKGEGGDLIELLGRGAVGPLDLPVELGERGGRTKSFTPRS